MKIQNGEYIEKVNKRRKDVDFLNKLVLVKNRDVSKLAPKFLGPYRVLDVKPEFNTVSVDIDGTTKRFSFRDIKPFKEEEGVVTEVTYN
ncbi:hypothetical protein HERIO_2630 [Hepatospora eriocheir]|uniref:Uncharacterized protein n=1 Tax=Hepatospora eriocheir TaxID=1081669 RepID=A0A1X0Q635_9MICR|nr:hypothetical protein HERIO_2630 [Hepatospora eriocheir]